MGVLCGEADDESQEKAIHELKAPFPQLRLSKGTTQASVAACLCSSTTLRGTEHSVPSMEGLASSSTAAAFVRSKLLQQL